MALTKITVAVTKGHSKHKVEVLAHSVGKPPASAGETKHASGWWSGDMRLVASPMRYKVQRWEYNKSARILCWTDTRWRFPRTRRKWVDWEYDCAVAMFQRRCWQQWMVNEARAWPSQDGRVTQLRWLDTAHLENIVAKIQRDGGWRDRFLANLQKELLRRNVNRP